MTKKRTTSEFVQQAIIVHGNVYDYSLVNYVNAHTKVEIVCPKHGSFFIAPSSHLRGLKCRACAYSINAKKQTSCTESFIKKSYNIHGNTYLYDRVTYTNNITPVDIVCKKHGVFRQKPNHHLSGSGCPKCFEDRRGDSTRSYTEQFIEKAKLVHGDKCDYSETRYVSAQFKIKIICPEHGAFFQMPSTHLSGVGCRKCFNDTIRQRTALTTEQFVHRSVDVHGDKYDYSTTEYVTQNHKVKILCKIHGEFKQFPGDHMRGHGCKSCTPRVSAQQQELTDFIRSLGVEVAQEVTIGYFDYDIVIPEKHLAIEYNGLYWHCSANREKNYHRTKRLEAQKHGYRLIQIWSDEWTTNKTKLQNYLRAAILPVDVVFGRKLRIVPITRKQATDFQNMHHVQGSCLSRGGFHLGLYVGEKLLGEGSFYLRKDHINLRRYTVDQQHKLLGGFQKLISHVKKMYNLPIVTFCDLDKFEGKIYTAAGFVRMGTTLNLMFTDGVHRFDRRFFMKKNLVNRFANTDLSLTEKQICEQHNIFQIFNSGIRKYLLN